MRIIAAVTLASRLNGPPRSGAGAVRFATDSFGNRVGEVRCHHRRRHQRDLIVVRDSTAPAAMAWTATIDLFVTSYSSNYVGQYNATTGATINAAFITGQGTSAITAPLALDGSNHLFVSSSRQRGR